MIYQVDIIKLRSAWCVFLAVTGSFLFLGKRVILTEGFATSRNLFCMLAPGLILISGRETVLLFYVFAMMFLYGKVDNGKAEKNVEVTTRVN